jgi:hypothetical protein
MDKDETFRKDMHDVALAPTVTKRGGLTALLNVLRLSGYTIKQATEGTLDSYGFTKDDKDNVTFNGYIDTHFPNPDTKPRNSKGEIDKNYRVKRDEWNKYAQHYRMVGTEKQLYDWYVEFISRTAEGKADIQYLNDLDNGMPKKKGERTGPYKAASKAWLQDQKAMYNARFNAKVTAIKKGISAYYQMQDIMLRLPKVGCGFEQIRDPENKEAFIVTNGVQPMIIWDNESRGVKESYSVSAFNNLDVSKALAAGGTFSDLMESTARGAKELGAGESLDWTQETWRWRLPDMVRATSDSHFTAELLKATAERDPKSRQYTADADDAFILMYELVRSLLPFYSAQGKAERYIEVTNARNAAQQKELNQRDPEAAGVRK